jgi:hypothetical protein
MSESTRHSADVVRLKGFVQVGDGERTADTTGDLIVRLTYPQCNALITSGCFLMTDSSDARRDV